MEPFFSIIIPTYNRARLIPKAIDSVLAQTYSSWELIIVDDGSKDNTKEVVASYTDPRIKYVYQQNAERCAARNNGIEHSKGQYICFLDSDDYFLPERMERLHAALEERGFPVALFYTGLMLEQDGRRWEFKENTHHCDTIWDTIALSVIHCQQTCTHRSILEKQRFDTQFHIGEDMELWLRIAEEHKIIFLPDQATVVVLKHEERTVNFEKDNVYIDQLRMLRYAMSASHPGKHISNKIKAQLISYCYYGMARFFIHNNQRGSALLNVAHAIIADLRSKHLKFRINLLIKLATFAPMGAIKALISH